MSIFLLDVNVLLALADPLHVSHETAHRWFATQGSQGWATCALTENGFVRIASNPRYPNSPGPAATVLTVLKGFCAHKGHQFWAGGESLREWLIPGASITHNQVTDVYLLGLAVHYGGKLATLDRTIPASVIANGTDALEIIGS